MKMLLAMLLLPAAALGQHSVKFAAPCESTRQVLSPAGNRMAVQCKDGSVHLLALPNGREVRSGAPAGRVSTYEFSPEGDWLGMGLADGSIELWSTTSADAKPIRWRVGTQEIELLKFGPSKQVVVGNSQDPNEIWDFSSTPTKKATLRSDFANFTSAAFSPDGRILATTGADTVVRFFDTETWKQVHEYRELLLEPFAVEFSSNGNYAIVGGADGQLTLLDPTTGRAFRKLPAQSDPVQEIRVLDENHLVALYMDADGRKPPHLQMWDIEGGTSTAVAMDQSVTGGGVAYGKIWMVKVSPSEIELSSGN